jgi:hypothetical protein
MGSKLHRYLFYLALALCVAFLCSFVSPLWDFADHAILQEGRLLHPLWLLGSILSIVLGIGGAVALARRLFQTGILK